MAGRRSSHWNTLLASCACCWLLISCTTKAQNAAPKGFPTDAALIARFQAQEKDFRTLAEMAARDSNLKQIGKDFAWIISPAGSTPRHPSSDELPPSRWQQYRDLFRTLHLAGGLSWDGDCLMLPAAIKNLGMDSEEKGYAFCRRKPSDIFSSLDRTPLRVEKPTPAFRILKDNWYLYWRYEE
jgi:hypothetical protein